MKRRDFLRSLSGAVAGIYLAFGAKLIPKRIEPEVNPDWENAEHEVALLYNNETFKIVATASPWIDIVSGGKFPEGLGNVERAVPEIRYKLDPNGKMKRVYRDL